MKKWKTLANPADASAWADVSNMWPTGRGSYEVADCYPAAATSITATNEDAVMISAWVFNTLSGARAYYFGEYLWELDSSFAATDRTGALGANAISNTNGGGHACQYGDVTIVTRGTGGSLIYSTGGNFSALAGSPSAKIVCVQSNCVVAFNTSANSDAWEATDVGDYTNWTTGEAASGRILENNGPITAAVPYGNDILVFKKDSIFRMTYVGGVIKWQIQKVWQGVGCAAGGGGGYCPAVATSRGVFFCGGTTYSTARYLYYIFDGTSPPYCVNMETELEFGVGIPVFNPKLDMVSVYVGKFISGTTYNCYPYYYSLSDDSWGRAATISVNNGLGWPLRGDQEASAQFSGGDYGAARPLFNGSVLAGVNAFYKRIPVPPGSRLDAGSTSAYIQTHKMAGQPGEFFAANQSRFGPAVPVLRRRDPYSSGSPALALTVDTYTELHDSAAAATASVTESTIRDRFDFTKSDTFCQLKLTATDTDIEIDDISCRIAPAGKI